MRGPAYCISWGSSETSRALFLAVVCLALAGTIAAAETQLSVRLSWGHRFDAQPYFVKLSGENLVVQNQQLTQAEPGDELRDSAARSRAGAGDVDGLSCGVQFEPRSIQAITNAQQIWKVLLAKTDPGAVRRLQADPGYRPDPRKLTIQLDEGGTRGFSLTVDQLLTQKAFWFPELDLFVNAGEPPVSFSEHEKDLQSQRGRRILERVDQEPEATYSQFTARWEDMGSPAYQNPASVSPGHIVGLTWDSALYKFGC